MRFLSKFFKSHSTQQQAEGEGIAQATHGATATVSITHHHHSPADTRAAEAALRRWYARLAENCGRLPLEIIDPKLLEKQGAGGLCLDEVYVGLDAFYRPPGPREPARPDVAEREDSGRRAILEVLDQEQRVVLLGDAGSGKTTFVNHLAGILARLAGDGLEPPEELPAALRGLSPLRLVLRETAARHIAPGAAGSAGLLWDAVAADIAASGCAGELVGAALALLQQRIAEQGAVFFLDGLDEVPETDGRRKALLQAVRELAGMHRNCRFLITARPYAYANPALRLEHFAEARLAPLNEEQRERFIERWYQAVQQHTDINPDTAALKAESLKTAAARSNLAELAERPLLLTLMATLHTSRGSLPEDRAKLYNDSVELLLGVWQRGKKTAGKDGAAVIEPSIAAVLDSDLKALRGVMEELAYTVHLRQQREPKRDDKPADIRKGEVLEAFAPLLDRSALKPTQLLEYLDRQAALLIAREDGGPYAFPHRTFQEYLAACAICDDPDYTERFADLIDHDLAWWREVYLLGVGKLSEGSKGAALINMVNALLPGGVDETAGIQDLHWRKAALCGEALVEQTVDARLAARESYQSVRNRVRGWLVRWLEQGLLDPKERAAAGDTLGRLGDPRPGVGLDADGLPDIAWVTLEGGTFMMGGDNEELRHPVTLPAFQLARYPVTVAQYAAFVAAGGPVPGAWAEQQRYPNRPVVAVSWFEATAFCEWLSGIRGVSIHLPSEAQWERAAAGLGEQGRHYPWGNAEWNEQRANIGDSGIGHSSAVGMYPAGATPDDKLYDLAGNVWEWTGSEYTDRYAGKETELLRKNHAKNMAGGAVLRGGSWNDSARYLRASERGRNVPSNRINFLGFRLARTF